jgi:hypothetical protein
MGRGAWLATLNGIGRVYIALGNKTTEFHYFDHTRWQYVDLAPLPLGPSGKYPYTGSRGVSDGCRYMYHVRGNGTLEFMRYDALADSWSLLPDVPPGARPKVKSGCDLVHVYRNDTGYVYLLKGKGPDFLRYSSASRTWQTMPAPPFEPRGKDGSWLCYDLERYIYAHPAKCSLMFRYDVWGDSWLLGHLPAMPGANWQTGRAKKPGAGGSACWHDGRLYALKGNNSQEAYRFDAAQSAWVELETIPSMGWSGKKHRVRTGGHIVGYEAGNVVAMAFVIKGSKAGEIWRYEGSVIGTTTTNGERYRDGDVSTTTEPFARADEDAASLLTGRLGLMSSSDCFDAIGRRVNSTGSLRPGVYYIGPAHRRVVVVR